MVRLPGVLVAVEGVAHREPEHVRIECPADVAGQHWQRYAEVVVGGELFSEGDLVAPGRPCCCDDGRAGDCPAEAGVGIGLGLVALGRVLSGETAAEPAAFHLGYGPDQAEQRHRGRFHGPASQLPGAQPIACRLQRQPLATQELGQRCPPAPGPRAAFARAEAGSANRSARCM